jgi:hypothetical protein
MQSRSDPQINVIFWIAPIHDTIRQKPALHDAEGTVGAPTFCLWPDSDAVAKSPVSGLLTFLKTSHTTVDRSPIQARTNRAQ